MRNSVKVTVDAYEGTVKFYVIDKKDPIIQAYEKAFPDLFTPFDRRCPTTLRKHLRYPEDLFKLQSNVFSKYHVIEPRRFYTGNERWLLSPDPNEVVIDDHRAGEPEQGTQPVAGDHRDDQAPGPVLPLHPAAR